MVLSVIILSGCAFATASAAKAQPRSYSYDSVSRYCDDVSRDAADRQFSGHPIVGQAARGATRGFVLGSVFGDDGGKGALVGASLGTVGGLSAQSDDWDDYRRAEYERCMDRNGY